MPLNGETAVKTRIMAAICLTNNDDILSVVMQWSIVSTRPILRFSILMTDYN